MPYRFIVCLLLFGMTYEGYHVMTSMGPIAEISLNPLMIGCSGGTGHNSAIESIAQTLEAQQVVLYKHVVTKAQDRTSSSERTFIYRVLAMMNAPVFRVPLKIILPYTTYPLLPRTDMIMQEVENLSQLQKDQRTYVDMLLDVYPAGYENAAIWNVLQKQDRTEELRKLIALQERSDREHHDRVYEYFYTKLIHAAVQDHPFTEVISTQAMSLSALCDAVRDYNAYLVENNSAAPAIMIHQYMTDLATEEAVHFFQPLSRLTPDQQKYITLYGVDCDDAIMQYFFPLPQGHHFRAVMAVDPKDNPMVRAGFKHQDCDNSGKFSENVILKFNNEPDQIVLPDEHIATIMLGGQGGDEAYRYIAELLDAGCEKVFVFGGKTNPTVSHYIQQWIADEPLYAKRIIPLGYQGDRSIAALMSRSDVVITRGGGVSIMEQMAMNHSSQQVILIHHADSYDRMLTSGVSWEDANAAALVVYMKAQGVHSQKTSPSSVCLHLQKNSEGMIGLSAKIVQI